MLVLVKIVNEIPILGISCDQIADRDQSTTLSYRRPVYVKADSNIR